MKANHRRQTRRGSTTRQQSGSGPISRAVMVNRRADCWFRMPAQRSGPRTRYRCGRPDQPRSEREHGLTVASKKLPRIDRSEPSPLHRLVGTLMRLIANVDRGDKNHCTRSGVNLGAWRARRRAIQESSPARHTRSFIGSCCSSPTLEPCLERVQPLGGTAPGLVDTRG